MTYAQGEVQVPLEIRKDTLWKVEAYRLGLFLSDLAWYDTSAMVRQPRMFGVSDQLLRAAGNISSNISEGYSRNTGKARGTYYEYALGSARESRDWYYKARRALKAKVLSHRIDLCTQIIKLTLRMIATERRINRRISGDQ
jgi:four helix bundle protein